MSASMGSERSSQIISSLHAILKPFLLRRVKADVEIDLPPKKEYVLYAPLTMPQREAYNRVVAGTLRAYLIGDHSLPGHEKKDAEKIKKDALEEPRQLRKKKRKNYLVDGDDEKYFEMVENGKVDERGVKPEERNIEEDELAILGREHKYKSNRASYNNPRQEFFFLTPFLVKQVNNMKLQNVVMQLRKVCSHPFLFDWPLDPATHQRILNDDIVNTSGKMMVLDRLLRELFKKGHKVLLFSQFTTMLDIIEVRITICASKLELIKSFLPP